MLGVEVELINDTIVTKRDAQRIVEHGLGFTRGTELAPARGARAAVESYRAEGWTLAGPEGARLRLDAPMCDASSLEARISRHLKQRAEASRANGRKGGRPRIVKEREQ